MGMPQTTPLIELVKSVKACMKSPVAVAPLPWGGKSKGVYGNPLREESLSDIMEQIASLTAQEGDGTHEIDGN
jgi:hypothetical protein